MAAALAAPGLSAHLAALGVPALAGSVLVLAPAFAVAGAAVGALFGSKHFLWCFLLAYLPARTLGGLGMSSILYVLAMGQVAHVVDQWRAKRRVVV